MQTKLKPLLSVQKLTLLLLLIPLASCVTTPSTSTTEAQQTKASNQEAKAATAQYKAVEAQTAVAQAAPVLAAAQPVQAPPSAEICAVFAPLRYHSKLAIKGTPYYDLAVQAAHDNAILLSFCPQLDPRNK